MNQKVKTALKEVFFWGILVTIAWSNSADPVSRFLHGVIVISLVISYAFLLLLTLAEIHFLRKHEGPTAVAFNSTELLETMIPYHITWYLLSSLAIAVAHLCIGCNKLAVGWIVIFVCIFLIGALQHLRSDAFLDFTLSCQKGRDWLAKLFEAKIESPTDSQLEIIEKIPTCKTDQETEETKND